MNPAAARFRFSSVRQHPHSETEPLLEIDKLPLWSFGCCGGSAFDWVSRPTGWTVSPICLVHPLPHASMWKVCVCMCMHSISPLFSYERSGSRQPFSNSHPKQALVAPGEWPARTGQVCEQKTKTCFRSRMRMCPDAKPSEFPMCCRPASHGDGECGELKLAPQS